MNLIRFEHINMSCNDIEASRKFYQTLFPDWYIRAEGVFEGRRWLHFGNNQFYLALNDDAGKKRVHQAYENIGFNHVGFVIKDGASMLQLLDDAGIEYYSMTADETKYRIYVSDPDGNEIELVEYQPEYALR
ncbi:MAG: VOC family protein [Goleter apudmare HA4340-LM2]|jgi:catechol 2,3-dioxygenase-like lactoylglutathione lyase family enzyme|nr:VOC family protein [Goleter apudmare HA4340-LM2]